MDKGSTIRVEYQTIEDYRQYEPLRLGDADLNENGLYHLMMRIEDHEAPALRTSVFLRDVSSQLARLSFGVIYTDADLRPATRKPHASTLENRYWSPKQPLPLKVKGVKCLARTGFFIPYESELDDSLRQLYESLSLTGTASR